MNQEQRKYRNYRTNYRKEVIEMNGIKITDKSILSNGNLYLIFECEHKKQYAIAEILMDLNIEEANALIKRIKYMIDRGMIRGD